MKPIRKTVFIFRSLIITMCLAVFIFSTVFLIDPFDILILILRVFISFPGLIFSCLKSFLRPHALFSITVHSLILWGAHLLILNRIKLIVCFICVLNRTCDSWLSAYQKYFFSLLYMKILLLFHLSLGLQIF